MAAFPHKTDREASSLNSTTSGFGHGSSELRNCIMEGERPEPRQFADLPVEIKEMIYEQLAYLDQPLSGTIDADFLPMEGSSSRSLSNCLSAACFTNKRERVIASRVFVRNLVFRLWNPDCNLNIRRFFDGLPENVGYSSVTEFRICCSYPINGPAWLSWQHDRLSLNVELIDSCPNLRTLTFAFRLYEWLFATPTSQIDKLADGFRDVFDCKNLSTINLTLFSTKNARVKKVGLPVFMGVAKWLQEGFLRRNRTKLIVTLDWKGEERWVYKWKSSRDLGKTHYSLMQQGYGESLNGFSLREINSPNGEAVEVLKLSLDNITPKS